MKLLNFNARASVFRSALLAALLVLLSAASTRAQTVATPPVLPAPTASPTPAATPTPIPKLPPRPFTWTKLALNVPRSISVFAGDSVNANGQPVKAWYADIDYSDRSLQARAALSSAASGRETTSALAKNIGALVAINGGYFDIKKQPAPTYSLVISGARVLANPIGKVTREEGVYPILRGAFGTRKNRTFDLAWVGNLGDETRAYDAPLPNSYKKPSSLFTRDFPTPSRSWNDIEEAIGGGPILLKNGASRPLPDPEMTGFSFNNSRQPRTAIGSAKSGHLILFVTDGRQPLWSMGMSLDEMTQTLRDLGCDNALNLDGGGSTSFVVNGTLLNVPSDGSERAVTSIFAIVPSDNLRVLAPPAK